MPAQKPEREWKTLDSDLRRQTFVERGGFHVTRPLVAPGLALVFLAISAFAGAVLGGIGTDLLIVATAAAFSGYMALNIGANDIANNMGPAVGSGAIKLRTALILAAIAEVSGALLAGGGVVEAIGWGIVPPEASTSADIHIRLMLSALIAAGLWVNIATLLSAPISTTHSVVGGVMGAAIAALGVAAISWGTMLSFAFGWLLAPFAAGGVAAGLLWLLDKKVINAPDRTSAAVIWAPRMIGLMVTAFTIYLLNSVAQLAGEVPQWIVVLAGLAFGVPATLLSRPRVTRAALSISDRKRDIRGLFSAPLVMAAVIFSFAHGANDVSNAIGPLASIVAALNDAGPEEALRPWVLFIGGGGLAIGLLLFGPRLIRVVGSEITRLNPVRSFCVLLAAASTVTVATTLAIPVSSTHTAIGAIFGIGIYREYREARLARHLRAERRAGPPGEERARRRLVRRSHLTTIFAAWVVTLPVSGLLAAAIYGLLTSLAP